MRKENSTSKQMAMKQPLHFAVARCEKYQIITLLNAGANVNGVDKRGNMPLHEALCQPHFPADLIRLMLLKGAKINAANGVGDTPWHVFCANLETWDKDVEQKVILLLKAGVDLSLQNAAGKVGVHKAPYGLREKITALCDRYAPKAVTILPRRNNALQKRNNTHQYE